MTLESRLTRQEARAIGPGFFACFASGFLGFDVVGGKDLAGREGDDGDGVVVGDGEDLGAAVAGSDAEVVHFAGASDADFAAGVDVVVALNRPRMSGGSF